MGTFISTIRQEPVSKFQPNPVWCQSLLKIKEYHGMFKYVCDCFVINVQQFRQIFGSLEKMKLWDPQSIGKVDALQIFSGLIMFAKQANFKKKLSFLFSIFDFNEIKSLSFIDVEVIILSICNSVYKILGRNGKVNENQIAEWLSLYLNKRQRVKITKLYKLCKQNKQVQQFFKLLNQNTNKQIDFPIEQLQQQQQQKQKQKQMQMQSKVAVDKSKQIKRYSSRALQMNGNQKEQINQNIQWHRQLINKIVKVQDGAEEMQTQKNYGCRMAWVYGINIQGDGKPFVPIRKMGNCIAYCVSSLTIIQDLELGTQQIIQGYKNQLSCIAYNERYQILAVGENIKFPQIKLYIIKTNYGNNESIKRYEKLPSISTNHSHGIRLMEFIVKDTLLATVGARNQETPIVIYDINSLDVVYQIIVGAPVVSIWNPLVFIEKTQVAVTVTDSFFALDAQGTTVYQILLKNPKKCKPQSNPFQILEHTYTSLQKANRIRVGVSCYLNIKNPHLHSYKDKSGCTAIITGHESGSVCVMAPSLKWEEQQIISGLEPVSCIQVTKNVVVVAAGACVYVYEIQVLSGKMAPIFKADMRSYDYVQLLGYTVKHLDLVGQNIIAMTNKGQFLKLLAKPHPKRTQTHTTEQLQMKTLSKMLRFEGEENNIFCLLDMKNGHELILFATSHNKVLGIDSHTRQIQDIWEISSVQAIVALDAVCSQDGLCYIICGCKSGRLYIRIDWEESPKFYDCGSQIVDAKISRDCSYLLVATKSNYLLFFAQVNSTFTSPRKLLFEYETPCSINFLDNFKFFLVITSAKNSYLIQIPQLKHKKLQKQTQKISISKAIIKYPYNSNKQQLTYSSGCLGGAMKFSILAMRDRDIYFFNNHDALQRGNYTILSTHQCPVSQIAVNQAQNRFYSLGLSDNTLIQWQVYQTKYKIKRDSSFYQSGQEELFFMESLIKFQDIQQFATTRQYLSQMGQSNCKNSCQTYFFKDTKQEKISEAIQKHYLNYLQTQKAPPIQRLRLPSIKQLPEIDEGKKQYIPSSSAGPLTSVSPQDQNFLKKRIPNISLKSDSVYGLQIHHRNSIFYHNNGTQIMGFSSRFLIRLNIKNKDQVLFEVTSRKVSYLIRNPHDEEILYSLVEDKPMIYVLGKNTIRTTHFKGILHMAVHKKYVLSYGKAEGTGYSINIHDYTSGNLLLSSYTDIKVSQFIFVNEKLAVSLNEVRIWESLYPSEFIITASAGCLMPNRRDVLLGLYDGTFGILSDRGVFHLKNQAHEKAIDLLSIKYLDKCVGGEEKFEIISVGRDEKIKIWTSSFQIKMLIFFRQKSNLVFLGDNSKELLMLQNVRAKSMDIYKNKILLALTSGNIAQIQIQTSKKPTQPPQLPQPTTLTSNNLSQNSVSQSSLSQLAQHQHSLSSQQFHPNQLTFKWNNIYQIHKLRDKKTMNRRTCFSINFVFPFIATSACDNQLIIRNYINNVVLFQCWYEDVKVECLRFSAKGNLIAVAFDNGEIRLYQLKIFQDQYGKIDSLFLKLYQKFNMKASAKNQSQPQNARNISTQSSHDIKSVSTFSIINMQFSQCSSYFAISYVTQSFKRSQSCIAIYKSRQSSTTASNAKTTIQPQTKDRQGLPRLVVIDGQLQYYFQVDVIDLNANTDQSVSTSKFTKSSYFFSFQQQAQQRPISIPSNNNLLVSTRREQKQKQQKQQILLIIFEQYIDSNKFRFNNDNKIKIKVYQIQDKAIYKEDFNINFLKLKFPHFVHSRLFKIPNSCIGGSEGSGDGVENCKNGEQQLKLNYGDQKTETQSIISQMLIAGDTIFYGDSSGKIHITKLNSLLRQKSQPQSQSSTKPSPSSSSHMQRSNMNLSKTYNSHTSFINQMQISSDWKYLFVSGGVDDSIVKYFIKWDGDAMDLDALCYPTLSKDVHDQFLPKNRFYDFLNNIDPIRDQISDVMLDVQGDNHEKEKKQEEGVELRAVRIFGRRAFDKRNNLFQDSRGNLIYCLGPNIIVQDPTDPLKQTHIPIDPNNYSNSPQISCLSMGNKYLIGGTEQESSRIFVWDIYSKTCLCELKLKNFSIIYHIVQSSCHKIVLIYGINKLYEASMQLVDWGEGKVLGTVTFMFSSCWRIKDICEIFVKEDGLQFVSCGVQHLAYWQYVADALTHSSFGLEHPQMKSVTLMTVRSVQDFIITGCENGIIYIFKNFELIYDLKAHVGPIRAMQIQGDLIYTGGMDGTVNVCVISADDNQMFSIRKTDEFSIKSNYAKQKNTTLFAKDSRLKKYNSVEMDRTSEVNLQNQLILAEEDIQSIVISKNSTAFGYGSVFVGTRSGSILLIKRDWPDRSKKNLGTSNNISGESSKGINLRSSVFNSTNKLTSTAVEIHPIVWAHDNDTIASVCFNENNPDLFYILTYSGVIQIWSLKTLKRLYFYKLAQQVNKIFCFKEYIIICCERSIRTVKVDIQKNSINYIAQLSKQYQGTITDCCLSTPSKPQIPPPSPHQSKEQESDRESNKQKQSNLQKNEKQRKESAYLVIGLKKSQFNEIIINQIDTKIEEKFVVVNLKYEIEFMDFSTNGRYLLFKDSFQELGMVNLDNFKRINTIFVEMGIEWQSEGVRISPHGQRIYCSYNRENKITVLRRIGQKQIIIGDQMGTIRTFEYPCPQDKLGELHTKCYTSHMNFIKNIEIHPTEPYALTSAVYDRSLILWKIVRPQQKKQIDL